MSGLEALLPEVTHRSWDSKFCATCCSGTWALCLNCSSLDITELKTLKGLALHDILTEIHLFVHRGNLWSSLVKKLGEAVSGGRLRVGGREDEASLLKRIIGNQV